ncbi:MAG: response regulator [Deltaproteobacteria bacterium]|jgi:signal transduction histidine kinase|nr:response regulator [Deltaproteobacteria bacterium]MBW2541452.1 response regulator [Deltaproteobacteria bacterium]
MARARADRAVDYRQFPILYVDDEPDNLRIFELTFRNEFEILTAADASSGLEALSRQRIAVVLSDHRMPGMTGVEFLSAVHQFDESTIRILVTAYGDVATLESAINSGSIYRFVPKPWTPEDMRVTLRNGIERFALAKEREELLRELTLLNRISKSMNQQLASDPLLDLLLTAVIEDLGYDAAGILLFGRKNKVLSWGRLAPEDSPANQQLASLAIDCDSAPEFIRALRAGESQMLTMDGALALEPPIRDWVTEVAAEQIFVAPLVGKDGTIGALAVDNRRGGPRFSADHRALLEGLADHAVVAISNARMVEDLRRTREQIVRADRLGTLGTLAAGLAHEINNPLVSIHTFMSMAPSKRAEADTEFWGSYHELACQEVDRIRRLVDTMRRLGRGSGPVNGDGDPREAVDFGSLLREVVRLLDREASKAQVTLTIDPAPDLPKVVAIRDHIQQIFMNILVNAIHASPPGVEVRSRVFLDHEAEAVCFEVADRGSGISDADLERIFDPFFTTKGPDQGTGLGLMICHRLVTDHQGEIEVDSTPGVGSTFLVRIPTNQPA